jgi:hypothetical protein
MEVEVRIDGLPFVSAEDWAKAQTTPASELPKVDESDLSRRMKLAPDSDARRELAYTLARERMREQGAKLAEILTNPKSPAGKFDLRYVVWDGSRREWIAVPARQDVRPVGIPIGLADRVTGWGTKQDFEELGQLFSRQEASA